MKIARPSPDEYPAGYEEYLATLAGDDAGPHLAAQTAEVRRRLAALPEARALHRYAPGKWSVKQVLGHLVDSDRIYAYRALRFARGDETPLSNFDEDLYAKTGAFDARSPADLVAEFDAVRAATAALFAGLPEEALLRRGVARGNVVSVRALAWVAVGHARHHLDVLRDRYGV
jgi:uncharacterized damage-inducible protein DinB